MIKARTRTVYYSPRRRRHFITAIGAARAEANCRMRVWFPPEDAEYGEFGMCTHPGWDWRSVPRLVKVHEMLVARYMKQLTAALQEPGNGK